MLHLNTIDPPLYEVLQKLSALPVFNNFTLVGGTCLALQLGHRKSDDLDFFTDRSFDLQEIKSVITTNYPGAKLLNQRSTGLSYILPVDNIAILYRKLDIYNWAVKFIRPNIQEGNLRLASLEDIAALMLEAICSRKEQKDYIDLAVLLQKFPLASMLQFYQEKFPNNDLRIVLSHLRNFDGVEESPKPETLVHLTLENALNVISDHTRGYLQDQLSLREEEAKKKDKNHSRTYQKKTREREGAWGIRPS